VQVLTDLSLTVAPGEIFCFLGPDGAAKTTTARLLLDLMQPASSSPRILAEYRNAGPAMYRCTGSCGASAA